MVAVGGVVVRRQGRREQPAGAVPDLPKEARLGSRALPVGDDPDPAAVGESESGDVDGIGRGMLAPRAFRAAVDPAAAVAPEMLNGGDLGPEMAERGGLDHVPLPKREPGRDRTAGAEVGGSPVDRERAARGEAHRILIAALPASALRQGDEPDPGATEEGSAFLPFAAEPGQLAAGEGTDRPGEVELRPGHVLGVAVRNRDQPENAARDQQEDQQQD